jgi:NAD(P)-dependent dehydrogenase (short-subunit alcohol dehydrogenase family)
MAAVIIGVKLLGAAIRKAGAKPPKPGDVVLVTGGCSGIGRLTALLFAKKACTVVVWDISVPAFEKVSQEIERAGGKAIMIKCDVTNVDEVNAAMK